VDERSTGRVVDEVNCHLVLKGSTLSRQHNCVFATDEVVHFVAVVIAFDFHHVFLAAGGVDSARPANPVDLIVHETDVEVDLKAWWC
jgi:hypothetical protein